MIERRAFIASAVVATLTAPRVARAETARKVYRIGILSQGRIRRNSAPGHGVHR